MDADLSPAEVCKKLAVLLTAQWDPGDVKAVPSIAVAIKRSPTDLGGITEMPMVILSDVGVTDTTSR
jgi:hypothetical protein